MKITVGDIMNNKVDIRNYLSVFPLDGKIYVDARAAEVVLIDRTAEWDALQDRVQKLERENEWLYGRLNMISDLVDAGRKEMPR